MIYFIHKLIFCITFIIERDVYVLYVLLIQINFRNTKIELYIKWIKIKTKVVMIYKLKMLSYYI